ncbi:MAG TPA: two-component regulator propeller domain-containing protein [Catalimonadaceae bacterium]|nr:two-component regulator propeller domain-containing protein [Catalimonadaceae bacterium]
MSVIHRHPVQDLSGKPLAAINAFVQVKSWLVLWLAVFLSIGSARSQTETELEPKEFGNCLSRQLTSKDGLSQGHVNGMVKDTDGMIWLATKDGLNQYNGYRFHVFRHNPRDVFSLPENHIKRILLDESGNLWLGTANKGIWFFNRKEEKCYPIWQNPADPGLQQLQYKNGQLLVQFSSGVDLVDVSKRNKNRVPAKPELLYRHVDILPDAETGIFPIPWSKDGDICWIPNGSDGFTVYPKMSGKGKRFSLETSFLKDGITNTEITCFRKHQNKTQLVVFENDKISLIDAEQNKVIRKLSFQTGLVLGRKSAPFQDDQGRFWLSTTDGSFLIVDVDQPSLQILTGPWIHNTWALSFLNDGQGQLFVGTNGNGALILNLRSAGFERFQGKFRFGWEDPEGHLKIPMNFAFPSEKLLPGSRKIPIDLVFSNSGSSILVGKSAGRPILVEHEPDPETYMILYSADGKKQKEITWRSPVGNPISKGFPLLMDENNHLWRCDYGRNQEKYLVLYNPETEKVLGAFLFPGRPGFNENRFVSIIEKGNDGVLWLGTTNGVYSFDPVNRKWLRHFTSSPENKESLLSNLVFSICDDPADPIHFLWVGTAEGGFHKLNKQTGKCTRFSTADGVPGSAVYGILPDQAGNLWISGSNGITCFRPDKKTFLRFSSEDGLLGDEFLPYESIRGADGKLFFGSVEGITGFYPDKVLTDFPRPRISLTGLSIFNHPASWKTDGAVLSSPIAFAEEIHLNHEQSMFRLEFCLGDYSPSEKKQYRYFLEGYDEKWINAGTNNSATYTNLNPGSYTFHVAGIGGHGQPTEGEARIRIVISPPWWRTWWFETLSFLVVAGSLYALYRYRLNQQLKILRLRDKIAVDLHDEIGSSLNSIAFFGEVAKRMIPEEHPSVAVMDRINTKSKEVMSSMSDIVWSLNTRNDQFDQVLQRLRSFAISIMEPKGCKVGFESFMNTDALRLDMEQRRNVYLLLKEAINNASKYAECTVLSVRFSLEKNVFRFEVEDNGKGFDEETISKGNGYYSMQKRAKDLGASIQIKSNPGSGTRIEVEMHVKNR